MTLYREDFLEDARHPRFFGKLKDAQYICSARSPTCGDEITLYLGTDAPGERVIRAQFDGRGCMVMMASASRLMAHIQGATVHTVKALSEDDVLEVFGAPLTPGRISCALLPWEVLQKSLHNGATNV